MGINKMAPDDIRPFKQTLKIEYGNSKYNSYYSSPFLFLHKPQIIDILYKLNCEDLIPYTQSCNTLQVGKCGECYACAERKWGFDYLDPNAQGYRVSGGSDQTIQDKGYFGKLNFTIGMNLGEL
jgi:7-cyano-7-deazaguanine synthase in queuosine biosynthesis